MTRWSILRYQIFVASSFILTSYVNAQIASSVHNDLADGSVYLINRTSVLKYPTFRNGSINKNKVITIHNNKAGHIRSLTLDPHHQHIFWGDFKENSIYRSSLDGMNRQNLFQYGIGYPQGLTVDWSSEILYWTDSLMKMIELATIHGEHRKVIFKLESGDEPRGITSDPINGVLFWTDWGKTPKIECSLLSGDERKTIIATDIVWPNDLAADIYSKRLYWIDAFKDRIEVSDYNGLNRHVIFELTYQSYVIHPFSFTMLQNTSRAYLTDWYSDAVFFVDNIHGNITVDLLLKNSKGQKNIGQIRYLTDWYPTVSSPCQIFRHTCSHLCLKYGVNKAKCSCPNGFIPINATTCAPATKKIEMYFADDELGEIFHLTKYKDQYGFTTKRLLSNVKSKKYPVAIDYHVTENLLYWTDRSMSMILRSTLNGSALSSVTNELSSVFKAIVIDQLNHFIFYFDDVRNAIMMTSLDGRFTVTIKSDDVLKVVDMVLYEEKNFIYFSDYTDKMIGRMTYDGLNVRFMEKPEHANSLSFDKYDERIYWTNTEDYAIKSSDYNFQDVRILLQESIYMFGRFWLLENYGTLVRPFGISVYDDKVYWSDTYKQAIFMVNKYFGGEIEYITSGLKQPRDLHVFNSQHVVEGTTISTYLFSFANKSEDIRNDGDGKERSSVRALCWSSANECSSHEVDDPKPCPPGYKEKRMSTKCSNCSETIGKRFVCSCDCWENCAQRTFSKIKGCRSKETPFIKFKVRECVKERKTGVCPFRSLETCPFGEPSCVSDNGCPGNRKCCETLCGKKCLQPAPKIESPCIQRNGGCSHICIASQHNYQCACPDHMQLGEDQRTCSQIVDICGKKPDHGPCKSSVKQYFYNKKSGFCEPFIYGGCQGNDNRFPTEKKCAETCLGSCYGNNYCGQNGICQKTTNGISCKCKQRYWIGDRCQIDIRLHVVRVTFTKVSKTVNKIESSKMANLLASYYSKFCAKDTCSFSSSTQPVTRVRRSANAEFDFSGDDVFFRDWSSNENEISVQYVLTDSGKKHTFLAQNDILRGMNSFGDNMGRDLDLKFESVQIIFRRVETEPRKVKSVKILLIAFFLIITILGFAAVIYYCYLLRKSKRRDTPANDGVRWAFENRLYDDMNTAVTLPIDSSTVINESFVNPIFERKAKQPEETADENKPLEQTEKPSMKDSEKQIEKSEENIKSDSQPDNSNTFQKADWVEFDDETTKENPFEKGVFQNLPENSDSSSNAGDVDGFVYVGIKGKEKGEKTEKTISMDTSKSDV